MYSTSKRGFSFMLILGSFLRGNRCNRGVVMPIVAAGMVLFLGMAAISVDAGIAYHARLTLQKACDLAAVSAASMLGETTDPEYLKAEVYDVLASNGVNAEDGSVTIRISSGSETVFIEGVRDVDMFFARIFGVQDIELKASSLAKYHYDGKVSLIDVNTYDAVPWGVPEEIWDFDVQSGYYYSAYQNAEFVEGNEYILKLGREYVFVSPEEYDHSDFGYSEEVEDLNAGDLMPWGILDQNGDGVSFGYYHGTEYIIKSSPQALLAPGNFGCLNLVPDHGHGGGASIYEENIENGYQGPVNIGDFFYPQTGNIAGPTQDGVEYRLNNGLDLVRIPVVTPYENGQTDQVQILGFLPFRLISCGIEGSGANAKAVVLAEYIGPSPLTAGINPDEWGVGGDLETAAVLLRPSKGIGYQLDRTFDVASLFPVAGEGNEDISYEGGDITVTIDVVDNSAMVSKITLDGQTGLSVQKTFSGVAHPAVLTDNEWTIEMLPAWAAQDPGTTVDFEIKATLQWKKKVFQETLPPVEPREGVWGITENTETITTTFRLVKIRENFGALDLDSTPTDLLTEMDEYSRRIMYGYKPLPPINFTVDTMPGVWGLTTDNAVKFNISQDPNSPWDGADENSSRIVLVPIVSSKNPDGAVQVNPPNTVQTPANIYGVVGRDKMNVRGYGIFFLVPALAEDDVIDYPDNTSDYKAQSVTTNASRARHGEVRGVFLGYHVKPVE